MYGLQFLLNVIQHMCIIKTLHKVIYKLLLKMNIIIDNFMIVIVETLLGITY